MPQLEPADVAETFLRAWAGGDFAAARALAHDDLHFRGPIEEWHRADDHLNALRPVASIVRRVDVHRILVDGDEVVIFCDLVTDTPVGTARIAEANTVRDGRLSDIQAFFDSHPWRTAGFGA